MTIPNSQFSGFTDEMDFYSCCNSFYENEVVSYLLGDSFHPGGYSLTSQIIETFDLTDGVNVIDIACGNSNSLIRIIKKFNVMGIGIDLSYVSLQKGLANAIRQKLDSQLFLIMADAHNIPLRYGVSSSIMSECSFCIFLNKHRVVNELYRVLKINGKFCFTDVTKNKEWPYEMNKMFHRIACIADAKSTEGYSDLLKGGGFNEIETEDRKEAIYELHSSLKKKVLALNLAWGLKMLTKKNNSINKSDFKQLNKTVDLIREFADFDYGSYMIMSATKK